MAERAGVSASTPHLAHLRVAAACRGILQDLRRPAVHREGAGHCRPLPESTRPRRCLVIRRKASDSSPRAQRSRSCRWTWVGPNARRTTTSAMARWTSSRRSTSRPARSWRKPAASVEGFRELSARDRRAGGPHPRTVHVILDNLSAHKSPLVKRWVARHPRFQFHFTPTYSAWLNLVERFFGLLTEHALKRGSHSSTHALRHAISAYVDAHNDEGKPFKWTKTADEILAKVKRFGQRTVQVHGGPR